MIGLEPVELKHTGSSFGPLESVAAPTASLRRRRRQQVAQLFVTIEKSDNNDCQHLLSPSRSYRRSPAVVVVFVSHEKFQFQPLHKHSYRLQSREILVFAGASASSVCKIRIRRSARECLHSVVFRANPHKHKWLGWSRSVSRLNGTDAGAE